MKTKVKCVSNILYHHDVKVGDVGYIDGYVRGSDDRPCIVCIFGKYVVFAEFYTLEVINVT